MSYETGNKMAFLADQAQGGQVKTIDEILKDVDSLTKDSVKEVTNLHVDLKHSFSSNGKSLSKSL